MDGTSAGRPTIGAVAAQVIDAAAGEHADELAVVSVGFFGQAAVRRQVINAVLVGRARTSPTAIDAVSGVLVVQAVLVVLQAVATDTASDLIRASATKGFAAVRRRIAARTIANAGPQPTAQTPLPDLSSEQARQAADALSRLLEASGVSAGKAEAIVIAFTAAVNSDARRLRSAAEPHVPRQPDAVSSGDCDDPAGVEDRRAGGPPA